MDISYPYRIKFPRTVNWWGQPGVAPGDWHYISSWCNETIGSDRKWDYINQCFCFGAEEDLLAFKLRWGNAQV